MIYGSVGENPPPHTAEKSASSCLEFRQDRFYCRLEPAGEHRSLFWEAPAEAGLVAVDGSVYALNGGSGPVTGEMIWDLYRQYGTEGLARLNGDFSLVIRERESDTTILARDRIGAGRMYYREESGALLFANALQGLTRAGAGAPELNRNALLKYLMYNYNPDPETVYRSVFKLRPAGCLIRKNDRSEQKAYWQLTFSSDAGEDEATIGAEIRGQLRQAVQRRLIPDRRLGAFLSGGLDSSSIVSLLHAAGSRTLKTFSFRCRGESFDESPFAEKVAKTFGTDHRLIEYGPEEVLLADDMTGLMEEPFCDVGINVATYLLARAAAGNVDDIYTGDGGDELFAGHPVYTADKAARILDLLPYPLLAPLFFLGRQLKDSEKKKDLRVKVKRFSESYRFPAALGTHRWRVYYHPGELADLVHPDFFAGSEFGDGLFADLIGYNREISTKDPLARSLYSDYQTAVQFYLRRLDMADRMGIVPRFPMLDPDVVTYCAGIPSHLKLPGMSDVKYIEKIAVEPLLPHEIVHRKDKLGHSIPLKNWMRDNRTVRDFMMDVLSEQVLIDRGIVRPGAVHRMITDHQEGRRNNSHRLWSLMILELWLRHSGRSDKTGRML